MSVMSTQAMADARAANISRWCAEYGSRRGWFLHHVWRLRERLGGLRSCRTIDWLRVQRFIFVCRGNICRSPYAARRARAAGLRAFSCGIDIGNNVAVDLTAEDIARRRGLDLSAHRPRMLGQMLAEPCDLLVGMEPDHLPALRAHAQPAGAQVTLLGLWSTPERVHLTDPYGLHEEYFNRCFMLIDSAVVRMAAELAEAQRA